MSFTFPTPNNINVAGDDASPPPSPPTTTSYDVEASIALPKTTAIRFSAAILAANKSAARIFIDVNVTGPDAATGLRAVNMTASIPHAKAGVNTTMSFALPVTEESFELRVRPDTDDASTSFLVNSRTLMGCTDPLRRGVSAPHLCPLGSVAIYLICADVRNIDDASHSVKVLADRTCDM